MKKRLIKLSHCKLFFLNALKTTTSLCKIVKNFKFFNTIKKSTKKSFGNILLIGNDF